MKDKKFDSKTITAEIKAEVEKLKQFQTKVKNPMTPQRLKEMNGFHNISDEMAEEILIQLEEYAQIILTYMNRLDEENGKENGDITL